MPTRVENLTDRIGAVDANWETVTRSLIADGRLTLANVVATAAADVAAWRAIWPESTANLPTVAEMVETMRAMLAEAPVNSDVVIQKLGLSADQFNAMYAGPVGGWDGRQVVADVRARFGLAPDDPIGAALASRGVLTAAEGRYVDDLD